MAPNSCASNGVNIMALPLASDGANIMVHPPLSGSMALFKIIIALFIMLEQLSINNEEGQI